MRRLIPLAVVAVVLLLAVIITVTLVRRIDRAVGTMLPPWLDPVAEAEYRAQRDSLERTLFQLHNVAAERDSLVRVAKAATARAEAEQRAAEKVAAALAAARARTDSALTVVIGDSSRADTVLGWLAAERAYYGERITSLSRALVATQAALEAERAARARTDSSLAITKAALAQALGRLKTADRWADWGKAAMAGAAVVVVLQAVKP